VKSNAGVTFRLIKDLAGTKQEKVREMKDKQFMRLALELAEKGKGKTSPNPMVGAVVVKKGEILSKGYHKKFGGSHAEAIAIRACGDKAKRATLYTTLEPCCHFGKTPPCTDLIIQSGIKKVVCASIDPNPKVNGKGLRRLTKQGIRVILGLLEDETKRLNEAYFKYMTTGLPFVTLKLTHTLDGRILLPTKSSTGKKRRDILHLLLSDSPKTDAILCDAGFKQADYLTTLSSNDSSRTRLILLGTQQQINSKLRGMEGNLRENVICVLTDQRNHKGESNVWKIRTKKDGSISLLSLLKKAGTEGISSLLVEGGNQLATAFVKQRFIDKVWCFMSLDILGQGEESLGDLGIRRIADAINLKNCEFKQSKHGLLVVGYPRAADRRQ
jgi:diaminohydroxyphosphoribosylaminopyrimidine deaminase/5-amino-6-(5-phosphoribosylamino)uracil reductase